MSFDLAQLQARVAPLVLPAAIGGAIAYHYKGKSVPAAVLGAVGGAFVGSLIFKSKAAKAAQPTAAPAITQMAPIDPAQARLVRSEAERGRVKAHEVLTLPRQLQLAMTDEAFERYWTRRLEKHPEDEATYFAVQRERNRRAGLA